MDRHLQREWVVKILYQLDFEHCQLPKIDQILENHGLTEKKDTDFIFTSIDSIMANLDEIDGLLRSKSFSRAFDRIPKIDKAILRASVNEFMIQKTVPVSISINEAVEIAKKYSNAESFKYINGILSALAKDMTKEEKND